MRGGKAGITAVFDTAVLGKKSLKDISVFVAYIVDIVFG
jgi:hypothetical protein